MGDSNSDETDGGGAHAAVHGRGAGQLVRMANDIGNFFRAEPVREDAIAGIGNHISQFWTQRMRDKLALHLKDDDEPLDELPREAFRRITTRTGKSS